MATMGRVLFVALLVLGAVPARSAAQVPDSLNILWRVKVGTQDYMSTVSSSDRNNFPSDGQVFYLYSNQVPGTVPVYRLYSAQGDHMDSRTPGEGGYATEGPLGYAFTAPQPGLVSQVIRGYANGDHSTRHDGEAFPPGYVDEPLGVYGFRRFNHSSSTVRSSSAHAEMPRAPGHTIGHRAPPFGGITMQESASAARRDRPNRTPGRR